jgi:type I restriction enzyme S subunit
MSKSELPSGWKSVRLDYLFDRLTRRNDVGNTNVLTISAHNGLINQEDFFNKTVASEDLSNYFLLKRGDFAYNKSYSAGYNYGAFKRLIRYDSGVISPLYICFTINDRNKCPDFYVHYFESMLLDREIKAFAQEGARNHGLLNIAVGDFFAMPIPLPPLSEQQAIAEILTTADKLIAVKECLIAVKQKQKQWLMQNLLTGKIRLPQFSGKWEKLKLGDICIFRDSERIPLEAQERQNRQGKYPYYGASGIIDYIDNYIFDEELLLLGEDGANIINRSVPLTYIATGKYWVNNHAHVLQPLEKFNIYFLQGCLEMIDYTEYNTGTAQPKINQDVCKKILLTLPPLPEQQAIANILTTADCEIELLKKELEQQKQIKKYLMQKLLTGKIRVKGAEA